MNDLQLGIIVVVIIGLLMMIIAYIMLTRTKRVKLKKDNYDYNQSFLAKLTLSNKTTKEYYNELKNLILSYENVVSKTCWKNEEFALKGSDLIKFNILNDTLMVYLPKDIRLNSNSLVNCGNINIYKNVPLRFAIRNENDFNLLTSELKAYMEANMVLFNEYYNEKDYIPENKTFKQLQDENLIVPFNKNLPTEEFNTWLTEHGWTLTKR